MDWTAHFRAVADLEAEQEEVLRQLDELNERVEEAVKECREEDSRSEFP